MTLSKHDILSTIHLNLDFNIKQSMQLSHHDIENYYARLKNELLTKSRSYNKLSSEDRKLLKLHRHHLRPKFEGGTDEPKNLILVSVLDHILVHFWRYQLYEKKQDKGAVNLLFKKSLANQINAEPTVKKNKLETKIEKQKELSFLDRRVTLFPGDSSVFQTKVNVKPTEKKEGKNKNKNRESWVDFNEAPLTRYIKWMWKDTNQVYMTRPALTLTRLSNQLHQFKPETKLTSFELIQLLNGSARHNKWLLMKQIID